jgi:hypothetical protein
LLFKGRGHGKIGIDFTKRSGDFDASLDRVPLMSRLGFMRGQYTSSATGR